jgi:predicted XRE-type DNA-binding protein
MKIYKNLNLQDLNGEIWKVIENFPDYQVSSYGRVKSLKCRKELIIKQHIDSKGYLRTSIYKKGKKVHRLVYETFKEKLNIDYDIHHINENKEDNNINNLEKKSHILHSINHNPKGNNHKNYGKHHSEESKIKIGKNHVDIRGINNPSSILLIQEIIQIKLLLKEKILSQKEIAEIFEVHPMTISSIKNKRTWSYIII